MERIEDFELTPFSDFVDEVYGVKGTPKRDAMEKKLKEEMSAYSLDESNSTLDPSKMTQAEFESKLLGALKEVEDHLSGVKKMVSWEEARNEL
jgi:hypothetical protein